MHILRLGALGSLGKVPKGISVGLRLHSYKEGPRTDPLILNIGQVVFQWAMAVWESFPKLHVIQTCLEGATARTQKLKAPWAAAAAPAEVAVLSLRRIGWKLEAGHTIVTDMGQKLELQRLPPALVKALVEEGALRASDRQALAAREPQAPWCKPIFWRALGPLLHRVSKVQCWTKHHQRTLRSLLSGGPLAPMQAAQTWAC